eukprot:TRINITY_DN3132_c0_g1_i1.p1 TRINITY_DN3132_c0_g1~~TRINITY_DN3132_c0_g1_i1.p1  ORF type:complete len:1133 (+),score=265.94 TRINITY_DN3132_c0_g1_i1:104-3400(+)
MGIADEAGASLLNTFVGSPDGAKQGGFADPASASGGSDALRARDIHVYLRHDIEKARAYREMPVYMAFLAILTCVPHLHSRSSTRYNELYHLDHANRIEMHIDQFEQVKSRDDFWEWFQDMVNRSLEVRGADTSAERLTRRSNFPIGGILLRQFRVSDGPCRIPAVLTQSARAGMPDSCAPEWSPDDVSTAPFGPGGQWTIAAASSQPSVPAVTTSTHTYDEPGNAFAEWFPLFGATDQVVERVAYLRNNSWVDQATRVVIVDVLAFNPSIEAFALNHMYTEFFATGSALSGQKAYPFELIFFSGRGHFLFFCDCCVAAASFALFIGLGKSIWNRRALGYVPPWIGLWEVFDIMFLVFLSQLVFTRFRLWTAGPALHDDEDAQRDEYQMFADLFQYGFDYEHANTALGSSVIFAWLRLFRYLQYNSRLGVLSGTIRRSREDLLAMVAMFWIVIVAFGIGGSVLYGVDIKAFSSWVISMGYLTRLMISAEVDAYYDELKRIHPEATGIFISMFMILTWCVLMNMVLAILNGAFIAVQEANRARREDYSIFTFRRDAANMLRLWGMPCVKKKARHQQYCGKRLETIGRVSEAAAARAERELEATGKAYKEAIRSKMEQEALFTYDEYVATTGAEEQFGAAKARRMFTQAATLAATEGGAVSSQMRVGHRWATAVQEAIQRLEQYLTQLPASPPLRPARPASSEQLARTAPCSNYFGIPEEQSEDDEPPPQQQRQQQQRPQKPFSPTHLPSPAASPLAPGNALKPSSASLRRQRPRHRAGSDLPPRGRHGPSPGSEAAGSIGRNQLGSPRLPECSVVAAVQEVVGRRRSDSPHSGGSPLVLAEQAPSGAPLVGEIAADGDRGAAPAQHSAAPSVQRARPLSVPRVSSRQQPPKHRRGVASPPPPAEQRSQPPAEGPPADAARSSQLSAWWMPAAAQPPTPRSRSAEDRPTGGGSAAANPRPVDPLQESFAGSFAASAAPAASASSAALSPPAHAPPSAPAGTHSSPRRGGPSSPHRGSAVPLAGDSFSASGWGRSPTQDSAAFAAGPQGSIAGSQLSADAPPDPGGQELLRGLWLQRPGARSAASASASGAAAKPAPEAAP